MPDWIMSALSAWQRAAVTGLAAELRAGGMFTALLAFGLGALHALTPGHGKSALIAYFLGREAKLSTGVRVALTAALLHVAMGIAAFMVLRFVLGQTPSMAARGSPAFTMAGYALIALAGVLMLVQSLRPMGEGAHAHSLTVGIGLLPCPLTISVLGFAWVQGSSGMVAIVLVALAAGIAFTIGSVALAAIVARRAFGAALARRVAGLDRSARLVQAVAGVAIVTVSAYAIWTLR